MRYTKDDIKELASRTQFPCVSLFLPTHRVSAQAEQDRIRLKNLLQQADSSLRAKGMGAGEVRELLEPAMRLDRDGSFWRHQSDGLAIFLAPGFARDDRVPQSFQELAVVSDRFHLKPLLPLLTGDGRFYVLAISQESVRLLEGTRDSVAELDLSDVPQSLAEALKYDDPERQLQFHIGRPGTR